MGQGNTRYFKGSDLPAGRQVKLTIAAAIANNKASAAASDNSQTARIVAGGGAALVFLVGGALLFIRAPRTAKVAGK
jgi:hypothetical protein